MKQLAFAVIGLFCLSSTSTAQSYYYYYYLGNPSPSIGLKTESIPGTIKEQKIKALEFNYSKSLSGKTKKLGKDRYEFNATGYVTALTHYNKKGVIDTRENYVLNNKNHVTQRTDTDKNGDTIKRWVQVYDESDHRIEYAYYDKKNNLRYQKKWLYEGDQVMRHEVHKKGKLSKYYLYTYHPNGDKASTHLYNRKGKEKYVWEYDCKPEGVEVKKHKDTSTVCVNKQYDENGTRTEVQLTTDEKGKMRKVVRVYNRQERLVSQANYSGVNEELKNKFTYTYDSDTIMRSELYQYYDKGILHHHSETQYNEDGQITLQQFKYYLKRKKDYRTNVTAYQFENGLMTHKQYRGYKDWEYNQHVTYFN
ncbi:MAG: hypothetical protein H6608_10350 [Flavobacteriales bacterium]|nr:hypothetical protein [Bacteroidota bacterium]MCB9241525.1 hypothetical protein [Flavobacteriales bacterium]